MRAFLPLLGLPLGLVLWGSLLWWSPPYGLSLRLEPRPLVRPLGPQPDVWRLEVTETFPHLEGLAVGDRVQFDRYGVLAPVRGSVHCVPAAGPLAILPLGGRIDHVGHVQSTRVPATPGCGTPARLESVLSVHP